MALRAFKQVSGCASFCLLLLAFAWLLLGVSRSLQYDSFMASLKAEWSGLSYLAAKQVSQCRLASSKAYQTKNASVWGGEGSVVHLGRSSLHFFNASLFTVLLQLIRAAELRSVAIGLACLVFEMEQKSRGDETQIA